MDVEIFQQAATAAIAVVFSMAARARNRPVYRDFTKAELDKEYSPSAWSLRADTVGVHCRNLAEHSALVRERLQRHAGALERGVRYGEHAMQVLDFYHPPSGPSDTSPLCVYLHGGYWVALSMDASGWFAPALQRTESAVPAGATLVALEYPLCPAASFEFLVESVRQAVALLALRQPARRLVLIGHSAGGHLGALLLGTTATQWAAAAARAAPFLAGSTAGGAGPGALPPADWTPRIDGALLVSGVFDLEPIRLSCVNDDLRGLSRDVACASSPARLLARALEEGGKGGSARPVGCDRVVVAVAERDSPEFRRQSAEFAALLERARRTRQPTLRTRLLDLPDLDHFDIVETLCSAGAVPRAYALLDALRDLLFAGEREDKDKGAAESES
eukprot:g2366.t1